MACKSIRQFRTRSPLRFVVSQDWKATQQHATYGSSFVKPLETDDSSQNPQPEKLISHCNISPDKDTLTIKFHDTTFTFHAQWLHDAQCNSGPSRTATSAFCQKDDTAKIREASIDHDGLRTTLHITWEDGTLSRFPASWLRVLAPLVAEQDESLAERPQSLATGRIGPGWLASDVNIPEISYKDIFLESSKAEDIDSVKAHVFDSLLHDSAAGIIKVVDLPPPDFEAERNKTNTIVTRVLKQLFGSVFHHPVRGGDQTFNVASHHHEDSKRAIGLPNYDTQQVLLPHVDHAHYIHPIRVQGWYVLEGESDNTFVSGLAVLKTLREEAPELLEPLQTAPVAVGRVANYYNPPMFQATVDTAVTTQPGFANTIKRVRWHPHLSGSLLTPFADFHKAHRAHNKFQEILRRDTHQLTVRLRPGDLYLWDNFRILHGRERVCEVPRTGVGQTVPEQVVDDRYRALNLKKLGSYIDEAWLVHLPMPQLRDLVGFIESSEGKSAEAL